MSNIKSKPVVGCNEIPKDIDSILRQLIDKVEKLMERIEELESNNNRSSIECDCSDCRRGAEYE